MSTAKRSPKVPVSVQQELPLLPDPAPERKSSEKSITSTSKPHNPQSVGNTDEAADSRILAQPRTRLGEEPATASKLTLRALLELVPVLLEIKHAAEGTTQPDQPGRSSKPDP